MKEKYNDKRVIFPFKGNQEKFICSVKEKLNCNWDEIAHLVKVSPRTIRAWRSEKYRLPVYAQEIFTKKSSVCLPRGTRVIEWRQQARRAGQVGGKRVVERYGRVPVDEEYRKKKWKEWWIKKGSRRSHPIINRPKSFKKPKKSSRLAEFVGIILGDGGISKRQITITLHRYDDADYSLFVRSLITDIFDVVPGKHSEKDALADNIVISRTALVRFLVAKLEMKVGNKTRQQVDMPIWVKENPNYVRACVRGLIDTDGSVFTHKYKVNGKEYRYKKLQFTSASEPLRRSVYEGLRMLGCNPRLAKPPHVWIDSQQSLKKYLKIVGSNNPKHLRRYVQ